MKPWEEYQAQSTKTAETANAPWLDYAPQSPDGAEIVDQQPQVQESEGDQYTRRGQEAFIGNTSARFLPGVSDQQLQTRMRQVSSDPRSQAAMTAATNPLNFGDEIKAGISALTAKLFGGQHTKDIDIGDLYKEARGSERNKLSQAQKQFPVQSAAIGFVSDLPFEAAALGKLGLTGAKTMGKKVAQNMAGAGLLGSLGGAGVSEKETASGVAGDALASGALAATAGGIITPLVPALGKGAASFGRLFTKKTAEQIAEQSISPQAAQKGLQQLKQSPEEQLTTALDIDSPEFQSLLKNAVSKYPQAKKIAAEFTAGRKEGAVERIDNLLSKDISPIDNYFGDFAKKQELQKVRGKENYEKAYKYVPEGANVEIELSSLEKQRLMKQAKGGDEISDEVLAGIHENWVASRKILSKSKPKNLTQFIKENGGIYDSGGDLKSMGLGEKVGLLRNSPFSTKGSQKIRITPDDVAERAWQEGYFPESQGRPTINELLEAMNAERGGKLRFSENQRDVVSMRADAQDYLDNLDRAGIDIDAYKKAKSIKDETDIPTIDPFGNHIFVDKVLTKLIKTRKKFVLPAAREAADLFQLETGKKVKRKLLLDPSTRNVDMLKRGLDSLIDKETDTFGKTSSKGRALEIFKKQLLDRMDELNPDYAKARNIYAGDFATQKAQELGKKFDKMQPEEISIKMKGFTTSEKDGFRIGQRLKMQEIANKSDAPAAKLFGNQQIRKQLAASFKGKEIKFKEFSQRLREEINYDATIKNLGLNKQDTEGSKAGLINLFARLVAGSKTGIVFEGTRAAETAMLRNYKGLNKKNAQDLVKAFTNKKQSIEILQNIVNKSNKEQKPIVQRILNDIYPSILGGALGYNATVVDDVQAADFKEKSIEEIKSELQQQRRDHPTLMQGYDIDQESKKMKNRYYR